MVPSAKTRNKQPSSSFWTDIRLFVSRRKTILLLATILMLAAWLRLHGLAHNPPALNQDEAVNGYDAYSLGHTLRDHHGKLLPLTLGSFGDSASVALTYLTIPFVLLGGLTIEMVRLPMALTGIASVALLYLLLYEISRQKYLGLLGAFLLAITPWNVTLTRWAIPPDVVPFFLLLCLWLFACAIRRNSHHKTLLVGSAIATAGMTYAYPAAEIIAPFLVFTLGALYLYKQWAKLLAFFVSYGIIVLPLFYLIIFKPSSNFARFNAIKLPGSGLTLVKEFLSHYLGYFSPYFWFGPTGTDPMKQVPGTGNFYIFLSVFAVIGVLLLVFKLYSNKKFRIAIRQPALIKLYIFGAIWLVLSPVPAALSVDRQQVTRAILEFPLLSILITLAVYYSLRALRSIRWRQAGASIFLGLSLISTITYVQNYDNSYPKLASPLFQYGIQQSIDYVVAHQGEYQQVVVDRTINQPYIYYLFFSKYDPKHLNYAETNASLINHQPFAVTQIGKYSFTPLADSDVAHAKLLKTVTGYGRTWFRIYAVGNKTLILKKVDTNIH